MVRWISDVRRQYYAHRRSLLATSSADHQATAHETPPAPDLETDLKQYEVLALIITNIFNEFWQTNAFFTSFGTLVAAYSVTNWKTIQGYPLAWHIGVFAMYEVFMSMWAITTVRHSGLISLHMQHAREIEQRVGGLEIFARRAATRTRLPSVRKVWYAAPLVFSALPAAGVVVSIIKAV
jgi:hypothetical protein